jgi:hypothetical protein
VVQASDPFACPTLSTGLCDTNPADGYVAGQGLRGLGIGNPDGHIAARPDQIAAVTMTKKPSQWFSTSSYQAAAGHFGNTSNGSLLGPGMQKWDMALAKNTKIGELLSIQLRAEAFDVFNHPNFSGVDSSMADGANFGTINGDHEPRILQLGAKVIF